LLKGLVHLTKRRPLRIAGESTAPDGTVTLLGVGDDPIIAPDASATDALTSGSGSPAQLATIDVDPNVIDPGSGPIQGDESTDAFYRIVHGGEHDTHKWYMHGSNLRGYFGVDNATVIARIREGGAHITHGTTDCNISLQPNLSISYQGTTSKSVQVNNDASCGSGDGQNTVGFGPLPSNYAAYTWWVTFASELHESDVRFNEIKPRQSSLPPIASQVPATACGISKASQHTNGDIRSALATSTPTTIRT